jgi:uncharacterized protein YdaU (DUF1376 family)
VSFLRIFYKLKGKKKGSKRIVEKNRNQMKEKEAGEYNNNDKNKKRRRGRSGNTSIKNEYNICKHHNIV